MKAVVNTGPNRLELRELPCPEPGPGQVRIRTGACGICATDLEMIAGWERTTFPAIPGHEWAGTVEAVGPGVDGSLIGKRCVAENVWPDGGEVGFEHPGGYGEFLITEAANVHVLPADFPLARAALIEPLAVAVRGINRLGAFDRQGPVLVFGDGPIGLLVLMLLKRQGVERLTLVGGRDARLDLARRLGAARAVNYHTQGLEIARNEFLTIVEASGSAAALTTALDRIGPCGKLLILGDYRTARAEFAWNHLLHREIDLIGSNASAGAWPQAVRLAVEGQLPLELLISHRIGAIHYARGLELMGRRGENVLKVVMEWEQEEKSGR